ncbi:hypothetical protein AFL01nite_25010 [Aeromicrobium flavum]|uniref:ATP/GTP-binding protein n=1 Tax=Aeromicrobium flavum TaxID=416568 RepID=A0A512HXM2_9ACTN|nr:hypothetical protein [Aeromicrobium flavum]GEO90174.1 hypothetical protein AFL01nite_25010 [Aeromicrobium flavum]
MLNRVRRVMIALVVSVLTCAGTLIALSLAASPASAAPSCVPPAVIKWIGVSEYECVIPAPEPSPGTTNPGGENPGSPQPTCDLPAAPAPTSLGDHVLEGPYCQGTRFCVTTDLVVPLALPDGEPPNEDSEARYRWCSSGGTYQLEESWWTGEEEPPSLLERALSAIGQINLATPTLNTSPTGRTLVSLDTWFWAAGASPSATGSAFDLVATATFSSMTVDPGDGSGTISCPLTTTRAAAESDCSHAYRRMSSGGTATVGGRPAYSASVRLVYDLSFTVGGNAIVVPGAPATLEAPLDSAAIRVDEVQSIVTDVD